MGYFTRLKTADIIPRENTSAPRSDVRFIYLAELIGCCLEENGDSIVPPAVKMADAGWWTVDGHNRLLVADLFLRESNVYVPSHKLDFFTEDITPGVPEFMRKDLNSTIERTFDSANKVNYLKGESFSDIRQREEFWFLRDIESAKISYERRKRKAGSSR